MNTATKQRALKRHNQRKQAERAGRIRVPNYPYSHHPYIPHAPVEDCFPGCVNTEINLKFDRE